MLGDSLGNKQLQIKSILSSKVEKISLKGFHQQDTRQEQKKGPQKQWMHLRTTSDNNLTDAWSEITDRQARNIPFSGKMMKENERASSQDITAYVHF